MTDGTPCPHPAAAMTSKGTCFVCGEDMKPCPGTIAHGLYEALEEFMGCHGGRSYIKAERALERYRSALTESGAP